MSEMWYVVHTKPRKEAQVLRYLQSKQIKIFYPTYRAKPANPRASKNRPFFGKVGTVDTVGESNGTDSIVVLIWIEH